MSDRDRTISDLNAELERLRLRIAEFESRAAGSRGHEEPLKNNAAGYRLLFEGNPNPLWVYDLETLAFLAVNDAAVRKYGYSREEFLSMTISDIRPPENVPRLREHVTHVAEGLNEAGMWQHRRKDGTIMEVEIVSHTLTFEGRLAKLILANDITERKQAEAKIRHITRLYALMSQINQAVVRTRDRDELFRSICRVAIEVGQFRMAWIGLIDEATGIVRPATHAGQEEGYLNVLSIRIGDEVTGKGPTGSALREGALTICDDIATDPRMLPWRDEALRRGYRSSAAIPFRLKEKVIGSLNLYAAEPGFFTEDERRLLTEIGIDISFALDNREREEERKRAEEALRESEERLRLALSAAKQGLYDLNVQTGEAVVTPEYARMLGHAPEEFIETNAKWIERLHPDDREPVADTYRAYVSGALPEYRVEFRQRTRSGEWKWILSIGKIVEYDASGNPLRMLGTHTDITDRKRIEQERLELERRLLHAQKLESLGLLAGGIAHDFNNLLMAVLGNLDLALRKLSPVSPASTNIEQSAQAARRAADLTRQMLAYSGRGRFVVKAMDLSELVEENVHLFRSGIAGRAELNVRLDRSLTPIEADAGQVQQVIMNLITNASEAIGEESGMITLATGVQDCDAQCLQQSRIEDAPPAGRFVFLEVSDTGCGMDEEKQQRLFDPFFSTKAMGRGLGMSAILGIVRGHGGAIFVDSVVGRGTTIRILFPALQGARAVNEGPVGARANEAAAPAMSSTVLVVDDEEIVRNVSKEMVEALGLKVLTAVDGRDAVDLFTKHADGIDLVILDLSMPNMDGLAAFEELVRIRPGVKVILSSGYNDQESFQRMSGKRLAGFIQKPYSMKNLRDALEQAGIASG